MAAAGVDASARGGTPRPAGGALARRELALVHIRWLGLGLGVAVFRNLHPDLPPNSPRYLVAGGILVCLAAGNLLIHRVARRASLRAIRKLGSVAFGFDAVLVFGSAWTFSYSPSDPTWVVVYLLPLEGALRHGMRGALLALALVAVGEFPREVYLASQADGYDPSWGATAFRGGIAVLIGLVAGWTARSLREEARSLTEALERVSQAESATRSLNRVLERKEQEVRRSCDALWVVDAQRRGLLKRLVDAQEQERRRIADDVHDEPLQKLIAAHLRIERLQRRGLGPELEAEVRTVHEVLMTSIDQLRRVLFDLRPAALDSGLVPALREYLERSDFCLPHHINARFQREPSPEARLVIFRIAREALANVQKHANASAVRIDVRDDGDGFRLGVADDGVGFRPDLVCVSVPGHLGLIAMRDRAELAGGWCRVSSLPGSGTVVECWIPDADARGDASRSPGALIGSSDEVDRASWPPDIPATDGDESMEWSSSPQGA